jgi:hypothetical protein
MRGIRVVFNKVIFFMTIFLKETFVNDIKKPRFSFFMRNCSVKGRIVVRFDAIYLRGVMLLEFFKIF